MANLLSEQLIDKSKKMPNLPRLQLTSHMKNIEVKASASILRLAKSGTVIIPDDSIWMTFQANLRYYETIAEGHFNQTKESTVLLDKGAQDGIRKVLFTSTLSKHWLHKLLFTDALHFLSNGLITIPLTRYILVDIDDVFVGSNRLKPGDVEALIGQVSH